MTAPDASRPASPRSLSLLERLWRWLAALAGAGLAATAPAAAQTVAPSAAPAEWVRYAEAATATIGGWLEEDGEAPTRLRTYLDATREAADRPTPPLLLRVWIAADGRIERIDFTPFAHEAANTDLRSAIVGRRLAAPPRDMLLPLRLSIQLEPAEASAPSAAMVGASRGTAGLGA
jgi:hypothetical protein